MKRTILCAFLCVMIAAGGAVTVETGSLRNFLLGSEPACTYDNWVSHLAEGIAVANYNLYAPYDAQTNGFGDFRIPNALELIYWNNMADLFIAEDYDGAQAVLTTNGAPFQIVEFHDTDTGRTYYIIRELPNLSYTDTNGTIETYDDEYGAFAYGWGLFIHNPQATKPAIITVPHPCDDFPTPALGLYALEVLNVRSLMINGAGREVRWTNEGSYTNSKSISDPLRYPLHPFNTIYKKIADRIRDDSGWREWSAQIHSYDWNRHPGFANCQISAGNPRNCPNLPIRDLSPLKHDLPNAGRHLMIPANTVGIHEDVYLNDFYTVNYSVHDFTFTDGTHTYAVNNYMDLPAYTQNQQMLYTQSGTTDYDVYEPFFHMEMDELPNSYAETENNYKWFYGWNEATQTWEMDQLFDHFIEYYGRWVVDIEPVLVEMFEMNDEQTPPAPTNLSVLNQSLTNVTLSWAKSYGYDFHSYEVLYGTEPIGIDNFSVLNRDNSSYLASPDCENITVANLNNANQYYFRLRAVDKNGNYSMLSNEVNTILAPANVTSLSAYGLDGTVRVYWQVGGQINNQGFKVYRKQSLGEFELVDDWLTNPALSNPTASSFEWWDNNVSNGSSYTYKVSSTNTNNVEFFYNYPASASPQVIHYITIRNSSGALADSIAFGVNPYASDGNDLYLDVTKGNPSSDYVWNAFWEQYWGSTGTQLAREIKGLYEPETQMKTWTMRVRSDQLENLSLTASDNFARDEKLYLLDGGNATYHNLLSGPYQFDNANSNIRTMTLYWGNMQPRVLISTQANRVFQGSATINFNWNYQYPFLIDHVELSIQNETDSLLVSSLIPNTQYSFSYYVPQNVLDMQECRLVADVVAVDGVRTRFRSDFRFTLMPLMIMAYNEGGWKTRTNPWLNSDLSMTQVFGPGSQAYETGAFGGWEQTTDYDYGTAYWVYSPDVNFFSSTNPVQSTELSFDLHQGWNFIPNPHMCAYDLEDLSFLINGTNYRFAELLAQQLVSRGVYVGRNNLYEPVNRIEPWEGLFIKYYGPDDLVSQLRFYPFLNGPSVQPAPAEWELSVLATRNGQGARLKLGAHELASDNWDFRLDLPAPPPTPFPRHEIWFPVPAADSTALETRLFSDYRLNFQVPEEQKLWNFRLQVPDTEPISFSFAEENIPAGWQVMLMMDGTPFFVGSEPEFSWTPPAAGIYDGYLRVSNYMVGNQDLVQTPLTGLKVFPNPFNPETRIEFQLRAAGQLEADVYNLRGQKVCQLARGQMAAGRHSLVWNGKDGTGRNVASGVYFVRLKAEGMAQTLKMMLLK